jgi:hypothetical protein
MVAATTNKAAKIKLSYNKDGWQRTLRISDMKFQWVRVDNNGGLDINSQFDLRKSAYVRKLDYQAGLDSRLRSGTLRLVPASDALMHSTIKLPQGDGDLVTYKDIANVQMKSFEEKAQWFQSTCNQLRVDWNLGHMQINIRRNRLLYDSIDAVMALSRKYLLKIWRFELIGRGSRRGRSSEKVV